MNIIKWAIGRLRTLATTPASGRAGDIAYVADADVVKVYDSVGWKTLDTGTGDVVGPASSTDNAIARYDGTTGLLLQNSLATVSDTGTVNIPAGQTYNINGVPVGATPAGSDTQLQRNNAGAFGGITGATSDGTNVTFGSTNLRATSPRITTDISDSNGNELIKFTATGSAVNEFTVANAATGSGPTLSATGGDANVDINIKPNGSGVVVIQRGSDGVPAIWLDPTSLQVRSSVFATASIESQMSGVGFTLNSAGTVRWTDGATYAHTVDLTLRRAGVANLGIGAVDAASPVAQTLSVQNVATGTSNTAGANFTIAGSQGTGTGAGGNIIFKVAAAGGSGSSQNALYDGLTITGANGLISSSGSMQIGGGGNYSWGGVSAMTSPSNGVIMLSNTAQNDFSRLQFGGTTSSFPALKRSSTTLAVRLADDSADAPISASNATLSGTITQTSASASAIVSGPNGATNPVLKVNNSTASQKDGVEITGGTTGAGVTLQTISDATNSNLILRPKEEGNVVIAGIGTTGTSSGGAWFKNFVGAGLTQLFLNRAGSGTIFAQGDFGYGVGSAGVFAFNSTVDAGISGSFDAGISRGGAANTVAVGNGTAGDASGHLKYTSGLLQPLTVATLPTGVAGRYAYVTDGDASLAWGATVVNSGGGATKYLVWYNGTNWTVAGK